MSKHTPGPWKLNETKSLILAKHPKGGLFTICHMMNPHIEEQAANFRLIAAAPDLLAALKAVKQSLTLDHNDNYVLGDDFDESILDEAIAKATPV